MLIEVSNKGRLSEMTEAVKKRIKAALTLKNQRYEQNKRRGYSVWGIPEYIRCWEEEYDGIVVPRGYLGQAVTIARESHEQVEVRDERVTLEPVEFQMRVQLRPYQQKAIAALMLKDFGTLEAPTGSGKTVIALAMVAMRSQPALVVVHTKELMNQWVERIEECLGIPSNEIGRIGAGKFEIGERITVALVQTLYERTEEVAPRIGHLVVDECHRCPSRTFTEAVTAFASRYMLGLSATPYRRDGLTNLIYWYLGDKRYWISKGQLVRTGQVCRAKVIRRETQFQTYTDAAAYYARVMKEMVRDERRNRQIVEDIVSEANQTERGIILALSDRRWHCRKIADALWRKGIKTAVLTGDLSTNQRKQIVEEIRDGKHRVVIATGQLIGEGFDLPEIDTMFLTMPIRFTGRLVQYIGRALRPQAGKAYATIYDYVDTNVGVLEAAGQKRLQAYMRMDGVTIKRER